MPPAEVEIWGGDDEGKLKLLKRVKPAQPTEKEKNVVRVEGLKIELVPSVYKVYKVVAKNVTKLPTWHPGKGDKGWIFIDEVFFN